jgi:hypothetical protein
VFVLSLLNLAAFAGTGLLAHRLARGRRDRQMRAALLWTANPLLLQVLVAGAHVDGLAVCCAVSALALFSLSLRYAPRISLRYAPSISLRYAPSISLRCAPSISLRYAPRTTHTPAEPQAPVIPEPGPAIAPTSGRAMRSFLIAVGAGALAGLAFGVKISLVLVLAGLILAAALALFPQDRSRTQPFAVVTAGLLTGFVVIAAASFIRWGFGVLGPALRAGSYVSIGSPWRPVRSALHPVMGEATANDLVRAGAVILAVALLALFARPLTALARNYQGGAAPGTGRSVGYPGAEFCPRPGEPPDGLHQDNTDTLTLAAASVLAVVLAWLVAWTYVLPWYDGLAWALLALLPWLPAPWAALDWLVLARTTVLALGYLPARGIALPPGLDWTRTIIRTGVTPVLLLGTAALLVAVLRSGREERIAP